jgi:signal transduction histidine kinase
VTRRGRTLPLRLWLILVVIGIIGVSGVVEAIVAGAIWHEEEGQSGSHMAGQVGEAQLTSIQRTIGTDAASWRQLGWQRRADSAFGALGVEVALFAGSPSHLVFATPGARQFLDTRLSTTAGPPAASGAGPDADQPSPSPSLVLPFFMRLRILGPARSTGAGPPVGVAFLWITRVPSVTSWLILLPVVGVLMFTLTLAFVVWLIRGPVLRPLAAMSVAAESIAGGDLEIHLPASPVREIAEVTAALEGMSGALRDSLARQSALEEERRLFIGAIAHDLRTPIFTLRAYLQGLRTGIASTPEKIREYIGECAAKADALERLIADLFAFTRLEYLEQEPERVPLQLDGLLRPIVEGAQSRATAKGITLALDASALPCPLQGDSHMLTRVVENLLDNAIRHTPTGGRIRVEWGREGATLHFTVADSGPGIAAHDLPHLFTPLYRGETSRNRQTGGAGLGLAIARRILRAHGGDLTVANGPVGAVFTATLPLTDPSDE